MSIFSAGVILPCYDSTQNVKDTNQKRNYFHFSFSNFFFCGGVLFSATARVQLCVKKTSKILEGRLFHAEVTSFNKQKLVLKREFRYVLSPPHCLCRHLCCGGESPRFGHVWRSPPASCSILVAGNKFGSAENYKNTVLKMEGLREYEIQADLW